MAGNPLRVVVLVSGSGTNLQALLDAMSGEVGDHAVSVAPSYAVVGVGADRDDIEALARAERAGVSTFVHRVKDFETREAWDAALTDSVAGFEPDLIVLAGFLKLVGTTFLTAYGGRVVNTHPALSPAFPGMHSPADALAYGVKVTGCTLFVVDDGVDTGVILAQRAVEVRDDDDVDSLHERIKVAERAMLVETVGRMARGGWIIEGRQARFGEDEHVPSTDPDPYAVRYTTGAGGQPPGSDVTEHRPPGCPDHAPSAGVTPA